MTLNVLRFYFKKDFSRHFDHFLFARGLNNTPANMDPQESSSEDSNLTKIAKSFFIPSSSSKAPTYSAERKFYKCRCFLTNNYFLKKYNKHVTFFSRNRFMKDYGKILINEGCTSEEDWDEVFHELETEMSRRKHLDEDTVQRSSSIRKQYTPLHPEVYTLKDEYFAPEFLELWNACKSSSTAIEDITKYVIDISSGKKLFHFKMFTEEFCEKFIEELNNFEKSPVQKGRPNSMNNYGILLNELGMDETFISPLRDVYLNPVARVLMPEWVGFGLDSHKAFIVTYRVGEDVELNYHYDNAEVTLNVCLGRDFDDGELYFGEMAGASSSSFMHSVCPNTPTLALLHRGQHLHGAFPITSGERYNLIIWMRSSTIRNHYCPMCAQIPDLVPGVGMADGFTVPDIQVCVSS